MKILIIVGKVYEGGVLLDSDAIEMKDTNDCISIDIYDIDYKTKNIYFTWDFGMEDCMFVGKQIFLGLTNPDLTARDRLIKKCQFELFHSFFHCPEDPNYTRTNWALKFAYLNRVNLYEFDFSC